MSGDAFICSWLTDTVLLLRDRCATLERENALLRAAADAPSEGESSPLGASVVSPRKGNSAPVSGADDVQALRDQVDDLAFQLANTKKRLKVALETIKKQAAQIEASTKAPKAAGGASAPE